MAARHFADGKPRRPSLRDGRAPVPAPEAGETSPAPEKGAFQDVWSDAPPEPEAKEGPLAVSRALEEEWTGPVQPEEEDPAPRQRERNPAPRRRERITAARQAGGRFENLLHTLMFPALCLWVEIWLHVYMSAGLRYWPIWALFALAAGFAVSALVNALSDRAARITQPVLAFLICLIATVEAVARLILQSYYSFSILSTAAGNKLGDYADLIGVTLAGNIPLLILLMAPAVAVLLWSLFTRGEPRPAWRWGIVLSLAAVLVLHLAAWGLVELVDWHVDLTPKFLYHTDTDLNDQVEVLGLGTMLRQDLRHMIFPEKNSRAAEFVPVEVPEATAQPSQASEDSQAEPTATPAPVDTSPNVMNIDLARMAQETDDEDVAWLANFFSSVTPSKKNEFTGMLKGYNVIFVTLEGFSGYAVDPVLTPTLYKMQHEGVYFKNYYTALHYTSTSNGECQHLLGLYPKNGDPITMTHTGEMGTNTYFSLARQLGRLGYKNYGYHNNEDMYGRRLSHENLGYLWKDTEDGMPLETDEYGDDFWPQRDSWMAEVTADEYLSQIDPFNVYYITITGHAPYYFTYATDPYEETLEAYDWSETTKAYVATCMEVDRMFRVLIEKLEAAGKLENTVIVASPDHVPYANIDVLEELSGQTFASSEAMRAIDESNINFEVYRSAAFLWSPAFQEPIEVDKVTCQVDLLPTLSNLLGLEYDSRMLSGSDALSDTEGLVVFSSRSWQTDRGFYNRFTQEFTPAQGVSMTPDEQERYVEAMKTLVGYKLDAGPLIVETDFYDKMLAYKKDE